MHEGVTFPQGKGRVPIQTNGDVYKFLTSPREITQRRPDLENARVQAPKTQFH